MMRSLIVLRMTCLSAIDWEQGREVELLPYCVETVFDPGSMPELLEKRLRWIVVMRHLRPGGHLG